MALVESRGLPSDSTCVLKAEPGKLDIKRREPGILLSVYKLLAIMTLGIIVEFRVDSSSSTTSCKNATSCCPDTDTCREIGMVYLVNVQQCILYER